MIASRFFPFMLVAVLASPAGSALAQSQAAPASAGDTSPAPGYAPICTNRPTKGTATCTAEAGTFQLETDLFNGTFQRQDGVTTDTYFVTNPTLIYGVSNNLDVEVNIAPYEYIRTKVGSAPADVVSSIGDLYLRTKYAAYTSPDSAFTVSLVPYVKAPTAKSTVGNGGWEGGGVLTMSYKLTDELSVGYAPELDAFKDGDGDGRHLNHIEVVTLNYSLPKNVTVSGELWGDWDYDPAGHSDQYSADVAVAWGLTDFLQLDAGLNFGLNSNTPGVQGYFGVSQKF